MMRNNVNLDYVIKRFLRYYSYRTLLVWRDGSPLYKEMTTYKEFGERINRLINALYDLGVKKQDRVAFLQNNCPQLLEGNIAAWKGGFVRVPLNPRHSPQELTYMINDCTPSTLIFGQEFQDLVNSIHSSINCVKHLICVRDVKEIRKNFLSYEEVLFSSDSKEREIEISSEDLSGLRYTSGTTGVPKAVARTHRTIWQIIKCNYSFFPQIESPIYLSFLPLIHASIYYIVWNLMQGGTIILQKRFNADSVLQTIESERVTCTMLIPTLFNQLLDHPDIKKRDLSSLKWILYATAPMAPERIKEAIEVFGPILVQIYSQTEALPITVLGMNDHKIGSEKEIRRLSSGGREPPEVMVRIVDEQGKDVPTNVVGEIITNAGDHTMIGYWNDPDSTRETIKEGFLHTRDMGYMDEDGYLYVVDRKSDMIVSGGYNIYPKEVEDVIAKHDGVKEVAVVGVPDEKWGESVKALIVLKEGVTVTENEIIEFCKRHIASYKKPSSVEFLDSLARTSIGKVSRKKLREPYWKGHTRRVH